MNAFIQAAKELVYSNGIDITFSRIVEGEYNTITGSVVNTEVITTVKAFPKNVKATSYNLPNLIGKEVTEYLIVAEDLLNKPQIQDTIVRNGSVYTVDSVREHVALGEVVIYKVVVFKG